MTVVQPDVARKLDALRRLRDLKVQQERRRTAQAAARDAPYLSDPVGWVTDRLGMHVWSQQRGILEDVRDHTRIAVPSAHSVGKSVSAALAACWWISVHPPGTAAVVTTAPTGAQIRAILWKEMRRIHRRGALIGRTNVTEWWVGGELVAFGRKSRDTEPEALTGVHARHLLVIVDEAAGFAAELWEAVESLASSQGARVLAIGNPGLAGSRFHQVCQPGSGWKVRRIRAWDTPNFTSEDVPDELRAVLLSPGWVERLRQRLGSGYAEHPLWLGKVEAEFATAGGDKVVAWGAVQAAQERWDDTPAGTPVILSVDPSRLGGADWTVWGLRQGSRFRILDARRVQAAPGMTVTDEVARRTIELAAQHVPSEVRVDAVGVGAGVYDALAAAHGQGRLVGRPVAMEAGGKPVDPKTYLNARAEWWYTSARLLADDHIVLDPADDLLAGQLVEPKGGTVGGQGANYGLLQVESKDSMARRGVPSTDRADVLTMSYAPSQPTPPPPSTVPAEPEGTGGRWDEGVRGDILTMEF